VSTSEPPAPSGIHHIGLTVTDLERSGEWYSRVLGLERAFEIEDVQGRGRKVAFLIPGTPVRLAMALHQSNQGERFSEFRTGMDHLAFTVADRAELDRWVARLDGLGVPHSDITEGQTGWFIALRDPDNIQLELYTRSK